jgi:ATP synthase I chain
MLYDGTEQRLVRRIHIIMAVLAAFGIVVAAIYWGISGGLGFAAGSAVSFLNFRWMSRIVSTLGTKEVKPMPALVLGGRYLLFAAIGYGIFVYSEKGFLAALVGCFIHIAAVMLEVIYELIYAGTP